jgi:deoxyribodipyrimidine photolyase-related protein
MIKSGGDNRDILVILGNQLFSLNELPSKNDVVVYMAEDRELCTYYRFHKHKIILFLAAMRSYADDLKTAGYDVIYRRLDDKGLETSSYEEKLSFVFSKMPEAQLVGFEVEDKFLEARLAKMASSLGKTYRVLKSPMFLTSRAEFQEYLQGQRKPFMKTFYEQRRKAQSILIDKSGKPTGGQWSFDEENRAKLDLKLQIPDLPKVKSNQNLADVSVLVDELFKTHPGESKYFWLATTRREALVWLDDFLDKRLRHFGEFEDAIDAKQFSIFHSVLSPLMNLGLLTPNEVIKRTLDQAKAEKIPLNSLEGFIRQIIGWREFVRGVYQNYSETQDKTNFFKHTRKLNDAWYQAATGLNPLDDSLKKTIQFGYAHHIERLMVIGCLMLLSQVHPREVHRWFMEMYVDSSDWVMGPNVYGMSQFSDGGIFATKPYICGSNYILKMSHYSKGPWCETWDGLYWKFVSEKFQFLAKNPRLSMMVAMWGKKTKAQQAKLLAAADDFIVSMTSD